MTEKTRSSGPLRRLAQRFARSDSGVTVVEFAIVGPVFFAIIGATIETAMAFFAGYALDAAIIDTSRLIRTGQPEYISSPDNYRDAVCGELYGMFDCDALQISVRQIDSFSSFSMSEPLDPDTGAWTMTTNDYTVGGLDVVMIEAYYKWPIIFNVPGLNDGQTADGKRLLAATHVFRTEAFTP